ncbi:hypothetical protein N9B82_04480 [Saprospiraceae bacterium]|nr:hypothetical protein [Saprospiraceae bacterium]
MKQLNIALLVLLFCASCKSKVDKITPTEKFIKSLTTIETRNSFLEDVIILDQKVRTDATKIEQIYGYKSEELREARQKMMATDDLLIEQISLYLDNYGFPSKKDYSSDALMAPYMVLHHSSELGNRNKYRKKYFPILYEAYKKGDFDGLAFFLGRMHHFEFGNFMSFENPYTEEFEIQELTKALGLTVIMEEIDEKMMKTTK